MLSAGNPEAASMAAEAKFRRGFAWRRVDGTTWTVVVRRDGRQLINKSGAPTSAEEEKGHGAKMSEVGVNFDLKRRLLCTAMDFGPKRFVKLYHMIARKRPQLCTVIDTMY